MYFCVLDFEATCWNNKERHIREIIEFPSILYKVTPKNNIIYISEFSEFVKPTINPILSDFCTQLTGITQDQVNNSDEFPIVYKRHIKWLQTNIPYDKNLLYVEGIEEKLNISSND